MLRSRVARYCLRATAPQFSFMIAQRRRCHTDNNQGNNNNNKVEGDKSKQGTGAPDGNTGTATTLNTNPEKSNTTPLADIKGAEGGSPSNPASPAAVDAPKPKKMTTEITVRAQEPLPQSQVKNLDAPKGFEKFFSDKFEGIGPKYTSVKNAMTLSPMEEKIIARLAQRERKKKFNNRCIAFGLLATIFMAYRYMYYNKKIAAPIKDEENKPLYNSVYVDLQRHLASFYNAAGECVGVRFFVDYFNFEHDGVPSDVGILIKVRTYFPVAPFFLLLLLPLLANFQGSFSAASRLAKEAVKQDKKRFKFRTDHNTKTRLSDVAGLTEPKHEVMEIIDFLKHPQRYIKLGAKLPKGVLLDGPPGVGKTLLAKAVAGEAGVPFVSCSGSEFEEVYVGVGAMRVRELFKTARESRPCVVFVDEIDAFGKKRRNDGRGSSRGTLNAFLSELDGFHDASGIIVLAATNRSDVLDNALTRSGRFDRKISLDKPPHKDRVQVALVHLKPVKLDPALTREGTAETIAALTPGCSGADIMNVCNEAAIIASRDNRDFVSLNCFHRALERVLVGMEKKAKKLLERERQRIAYHEAGHAVLSWFQNHTDPVMKVSIVPRGGSRIGVTQLLPMDRYIRTEEMLTESMIQTLGGFVTEEYFFDDLSTSAADDLKHCTDIAWNIVTKYGMEPEKVGHFHYETDSQAIQKPYGTEKEDLIDEAVAKIVDKTAERARELLKQYLMQVRIVAGLLIRNETVSAQELFVVLGDRPNMTPEFRAFLQA